MSDSIWPWIILAVIVVIAIIWLATMMKKHKAEQHRAKAADLRNDAASQAGGVRESELRARDAEAEAERKRVEAERAEHEATQARQAQAQDEAGYEERLREADRIDPDVDHRADDYAPGTGEHRGTPPV